MPTAEQIAKSQYMRARYAARRAQGLCPACGSPAAPGMSRGRPRVHCAACVEKVRGYKPRYKEGQ